MKPDYVVVDIPPEWHRESLKRRAVVKLVTVQHQVVDTEGPRVRQRQVAVKFGPTVRKSEYHALQLVHASHTIPCPEPLAFYTVGETSSAISTATANGRRGGLGEIGVLVMTVVPGIELGSLGPKKMNPEQRRAILRQVGELLDALDRVLKSRGQGPPVRGALSNVDGSGCLALPLLNEDTSSAGPVVWTQAYRIMSTDHPALPEHVHPDLIRRRDQILECILREASQTTLSSSHSSDLNHDGKEESHSALRFCHMDLHEGNIMVMAVPAASDSASGSVTYRLSGVVDWEQAGWYTARLEAYAALYHGWEGDRKTRPPRTPEAESYVDTVMAAWPSVVDDELVDAAIVSRQILLTPLGHALSTIRQLEQQHHAGNREQLAPTPASRRRVRRRRDPPSETVR